MQPSRILIAGCGFVGTQLGLELAAEGHEVWALRRNPDAVPAPLRPLAADLARPQTLAALPPGIGMVFFTAAPDRHDEEGYRSVYVDGLRHLLAALADQGQEPRRLLFTSSTAVFGQSSGEWVDEDSETHPKTFSGRTLLEAEELVAAAPYRSVVVRLAGIYGPGRGSMVDKVRRGTATYTEGAPRFTNRIHRDDCAGVLRHLAELEAPRPLYIAADNEPTEARTVLTWIAERLGAPPPSAQPAVEVRPWERGASKRCRNELLVASGYRFRFPSFREGYGAILDALPA